MSKILICHSLKGGTGKTKVTQAIAKELSLRLHSVVILDLDVTTPNIHEMEGVTVVASKTRAIPTKRVIHKLLNQARKSKSDYIIIDTPPTVSEVTLTLMEKIAPAPQLVFITTPSRNAVIDTGLGIKLFASRGANMLGVIQNMVGDDFGQEFDSIAEFGLPTICSLYLSDKSWDKKFIRIVDKLIPLIEVSDVVEDRVSRVLKTVTTEDIKNSYKDGGYAIPLRFYNLESWEFVRNILVDLDATVALTSTGDYTKSRYDVPTEFLQKAIDAGEYANVIVMARVPAANAPPRYTVEEVKISWIQDVSKGLPMFLFKSGVLLWPDEVAILSTSDYETIILSGDFIEAEAGTFYPNAFTLVSMLRSLERLTPNEEVDEIKHLFTHSVKPDEKLFISGLAVLAGEVSNSKASNFDIDKDASHVFKTLYEAIYKPLYCGT